MVTKFRALRKSSGLTQCKLAKRLNLDQTTISKWEKGVAYPRIDMLTKLKNLLNTDYETLIKSFQYESQSEVEA